MAERRYPINWQIVILAMIASIPATLVALATFFQAYEAKQQTLSTHTAVNGRMSKTIDDARAEAMAIGILTERDAQTKRRLDAMEKPPARPRVPLPEKM